MFNIAVSDLLPLAVVILVALGAGVLWLAGQVVSILKLFTKRGNH